MHHLEPKPEPKPERGAQPERRALGERESARGSKSESSGRIAAEKEAFHPPPGPTYVPTTPSLPAYLRTYVPTYVPTDLPSTYLPTSLPASLPPCPFLPLMMAKRLAEAAGE